RRSLPQNRQRARLASRHARPVRSPPPPHRRAHGQRPRNSRRQTPPDERSPRRHLPHQLPDERSRPPPRQTHARDRTPRHPRSPHHPQSPAPIAAANRNRSERSKKSVILSGA